MTSLECFGKLRWLDGAPLVSIIEPYRATLFTRFLDEKDAAGVPRYNLGLFGRAKKNWKTADLVLASLFVLLTDSPHGSQVYLIANDEGQANDDFQLLKKLIAVNPAVGELVKVTKGSVTRKDGGGFIEILPAQDVVGSHGKTYRLLAVDEIHGYRDWDLMEALAPDPTRPDCQQWITSYASLFHKPGAPLFDMLHQARAGADPRLLCSWYAADYCTDPAMADQSPEARANPSMLSWHNPAYLAQQQLRLPAHKFRRLHLNLGGLPAGSAFQPEPIMDSIERGVAVRLPEDGLAYRAFVDMSGGSNDDACLAVGHKDRDGKAIIDHVLNQGPHPPFDPRLAVERFAAVLQTYRVRRVTGDRYAGETFRADFRRVGVDYAVAGHTTSQHYEALEPRLNGHAVMLPDVPILEQQLLGLIWRGGKIDHATGEHDDFACAAAGVADLLLGVGPRVQTRATW